MPVGMSHYLEQTLEKASARSKLGTNIFCARRAEMLRNVAAHLLRTA